ncbi:MAG: hypothetical protein Ta2A_07910 [Treponemataceae bacterium]|nr:MAG: hypothetical protein Ta2A_07910 [Treponemataceae bacterium]
MAKTTHAHGDAIHIKAIFLIVDWDKVTVISEVVAKKNAVCYVSKGRGTANSELLDILGIGSIDKAVFICFVESAQMQSLVQSVRHAMGARSTGAGIAFSVHLSAVTAPILKMFEEMKAEDDAKQLEEGIQVSKNKETFMASILPHKESIAIKNDMIISVLNAGYSDAFMAEARKAGARGGTVINARGLSTQLVKKFLGFSVLEEKEIVIILAQSDVKLAIMQAISAGFGGSTKAAGLIFSLPVDQVMSLNSL